MKTRAFIIATTAVLGLAACSSNNPAHKAPGTYKKETERTTSSGTTYKTRETTDVTVDQYGNKKATVKTETSKDPKGLLNKTTTSSKKTYIE